jgi:hypothetical protein
MRPCLIVLPLLLIATLAHAQQAKQPPFEWKLSGDSVENFKMEFVAHHVTDRTTAKGAVLSYAAFTDNRESTAAMMKEVGEKWDKAVRKSLAKYEKELLTAEAIEAIDEHENDQPAGAADVKRTMGKTIVTDETGDSTGTTWVMTSQMITQRQRQPGTGKWSEKSQALKRRFACRKDADGNWRITKIQQGDGKNWQDDVSMLQYIMYARKLDDAAKPVPAPDTGSAKAAAKSLFESLLVRRAQLDNTVHAKGLDDWLKVLKPLFTDAYVKQQDKQAQAWIDAKAEQKKNEKPREVESVSDGDGGLKIVKFKPRDQWTGAIEISVKKTDAGWRVVSARFYELGTNKKNKIGWIECDEPNLYKLALR